MWIVPEYLNVFVQQYHTHFMTELNGNLKKSRAQYLLLICISQSHSLVEMHTNFSNVSYIYFVKQNTQIKM